MTSKDVCKLCTEYSDEYDCDFADKCVLMKLLEENKKMRKSIKNLRERIKKLEEESVNSSWVNNPDRMGR